jgi:SAM-dependent methyltransferase
MDTSTYAVEAEVEATHWWFVARRRLLADLIARQRIPRDARVLDIGTSTGSNLRLLKELGFDNRRGLDLSDDAIRWCAEKGFGKVEKGDVCNLPFANGEFELVLATDIIEHVDDDFRAISEIRRVLAPKGVAIITVPAFESFWGLQDEIAHHKRRYRRNELVTLIERSGLTCLDSFYFNYLLFLPIWGARQVIRLLRVNLESEAQVNTPLLNRLLTWIFTLDVTTARVLHPPFGVSIMAVTKPKPDSPPLARAAG